MRSAKAINSIPTRVRPENMIKLASTSVISIMEDINDATKNAANLERKNIQLMESTMDIRIVMIKPIINLNASIRFIGGAYDNTPLSLTVADPAPI
mmetsp:Transcript_7341/g.10176  ORF Transcript_7341/g.10176 Transcript_7341/m.10176 type:complete len:96 (-) Transcript_7341:180-467(-)